MQEQIATLSKEAAQEAATSGRIVEFVRRGYRGTISPLSPGSSRFNYRFTGRKIGGTEEIEILVDPQDLIFPAAEDKEE